MRLGILEAGASATLTPARPHQAPVMTYALFPSGGPSALASVKGTSKSGSSFFGVFTLVEQARSS